MNLVLVSETFAPEINGVAMTLGHLVEGVAQAGHRVTVVRPRQGEGDRPRSDGLYEERLFRGFPLPGYALLRLGLPAGGALRRWWKNERPDVVHIATEGPLGLSALRAARALGIPVTSSFHTNFHHYGRHYGVGWLLRPALAYLRWFHNLTRVTLSPTRELNEALEKDGFRNLDLMARGVNTRVFTPRIRDEKLRREWGVAPATPVILHVSRLAREKNYELLFRTYEELRRRDPSLRFVVVSDGPLKRKLERRYPWAHFTGFLSRDDLARHYASADYFLYPSMTETFGNVVTEAMASGLAVLAYHYAAPARYIENGVSGVTVSFGEEEAFVEAAKELLQDRAAGRRMGEAARLVAEGIHWEPVVSGFASALERARMGAKTDS